MSGVKAIGKTAMVGGRAYIVARDGNRDIWLCLLQSMKLDPPGTPRTLIPVYGPIGPNTPATTKSGATNQYIAVGKSFVGAGL